MNSPTTYNILLVGLKEKIRLARIKAAVSINKQLLIVYWEIGNVILQQQSEEGWGTKVVDRLAADLKSEFPELKGLSPRNLKYMRVFAETYPQFVQAPSAQIEDTESPINKMLSIVQTPSAQLSWSHQIVLLEKIKSLEERLFYTSKTIENGWSVNILKRQIETNLYRRQGNAITNFESMLPKPHSDLAREILKSPYVLDFLALSEDMHEREFERALIEHLKKFMLELGKGFAYVGNQHNLNVEGNDYFLDLLFYNYKLQRFIVFELKVGDFKPEYAGKLNFYVNTINEQLKGENDLPTIGVLLCKTPNETVVKYSLDGIKTPIGVAEYVLAQALPEQFESEMPTIEELEIELEKEAEKFQKPMDRKLDNLKKLISNLNIEEVKETVTKQHIEDIFEKTILPLKEAIVHQINHMIASSFNVVTVSIYVNGNNIFSSSDLLKFNLAFDNTRDVKIVMDLKGFRPVGIKAFDIWKDLNFQFDQYKYFAYLDGNRNHLLFENLYHQFLSEEKMPGISDSVVETIIDDISQRVEYITKQP